MRSHEDGVRLDRSHAGRHPVRNPPLQVGEGHPGPTGAGCEILGMITERKDAQPEGARPQHGRSSGPIDVGSGTRPRDPDPGEMVERVPQGLLAEVEGMVVGQGDAVDPQDGKCFGRGRGSAKEEGLAGCGPPGSPLGDATLQVHDEQVGLVGDLHDLGGKQRLGRGRGQSVRDATSEHRVSGQRELDGHAPILPHPAIPHLALRR